MQEKKSRKNIKCKYSGKAIRLTTVIDQASQWDIIFRVLI